jgi:hypothetical protein
MPARVEASDIDRARQKAVKLFMLGAVLALGAESVHCADSGGTQHSNGGAARAMPAKTAGHPKGDITPGSN